MTSVLIIGDTHGNPQALEIAYITAKMHNVEAIIQLGDYGYGWRFVRDIDNTPTLDPRGYCAYAALTHTFFRETGIPLFFIDGNHENFDALLKNPIDPTTGLRPILDGVTHLPRGSVLEIRGVRFKAFGGAYSVDKGRRSPGTSWWPQETITDEDVAYALSTGPADIFLAHDAPRGINNDNATRQFLDTYFDKGSAERSFVNQDKVREVLIDSTAPKMFHGHLHQHYQKVLRHPHGSVNVIALDKETAPHSKALLHWDDTSNDGVPVIRTQLL